MKVAPSAEFAVAPSASGQVGATAAVGVGQQKRKEPDMKNSSVNVLNSHAPVRHFQMFVFSVNLNMLFLPSAALLSLSPVPIGPRVRAAVQSYTHGPSAWSILAIEASWKSW